MLTSLRRMLVNSWVGWIVVGSVFVVFISWGIGDIISAMSMRDTAIAKVGDKRISPDELSNVVKNGLQQFAMQNGYTDPSQMPNIMRQDFVKQNLQVMINQNLITNYAHYHGILTPDKIVRDVVFSMPDFQKNGKFDRYMLNQALRNNNISEAQFLNTIRDLLAAQASIYPLQKGLVASEQVVKKQFDFSYQTRTLAYITVPFSHFKAEKTPDNAVLERYYQNHLWEFKAPEYRRVRMVILSPQTVARTIDISNDQLHHYYDAQAGLINSPYNTPETRDIRIITSKDQKEAEKIAATWRSGASWSSIQSDFGKDNAVVDMPNIRQSDLPLPDLAKEIFTSSAGQVVGPKKSFNNWVVYQVNKIKAAHHIRFEDAKSDLRIKIASEQAMQLMGERIRKLQDILAGGIGLDHVPGDIGASVIEGNLDMNGLTEKGEDALLPIQGQMRKDVLIKFFSTGKGLPPRLIQGTDGMYYAFTVEDITPERIKKFEEAKDIVLKNWQSENIYRQANQVATQLYLNAKNDQNPVLKQTSAEYPVTISSDFSRAQLSKDLPPNLMETSFNMTIGKSTMVESPNGFIVAKLIKASQPDSKNQSTEYQTLKDNLTVMMQDDIVQSYIAFLQNSQKVQINQKILDMMLKQDN